MSYEDRFRTPEAAQTYRATYEAALALWPVPHEALDVNTRFGTTHINAAGSPDAPPLVLLHGAQVSSTMWYPNVEPLSRHFRIYAPDVVDQSGLSVPTRRLKTPQDCLDWLNDVLDGLHIDRAPLVGHSQGCWQALNLAQRNPERVERLVLLSPTVPIARLRWQPLVRMLPVFIRPTRPNFYSGLQWMSVTPLDHRQPHPLIEQLITGALSYKPGELSLGVTSMFSDDELRQITTPTLILIGDHEQAVNPKQVLERARRLMPHVEAEMVANAGHLMPVEQADIVNARMLKFLTT